MRNKKPPQKHQHTIYYCAVCGNKYWIHDDHGLFWETVCSGCNTSVTLCKDLDATISANKYQIEVKREKLNKQLEAQTILNGYKNEM